MLRLSTKKCGGCNLFGGSLKGAVHPKAKSEDAQMCLIYKYLASSYKA